ncbi:hypothetical protein CC2G_013672 [Coprinopsis cinerea AmutBmut pab1-1]|nr:hypothetical protein CC2G_013672 [Coprinopsis cinerea AmutBmut pab1-1]
MSPRLQNHHQRHRFQSQVVQLPRIIGCPILPYFFCKKSPELACSAPASPYQVNRPRKHGFSRVILIVLDSQASE